VRIYCLTNLVDSGSGADQRVAGEQIIGIIRKLIQPKSWGDPDAYIALAAGSIVVRQTPAVHGHIQNLIDALAAKPKPKAQNPVVPTATQSTGVSTGGAF
jgi:hypothetical protein